MSDSYPIIQESLSEMQKEFMGCVEMHLDPPDHDDPSYSVQALYRKDDDDSALPGNGVRFTISVDEHDSEISERRHVIEFVEMNGGQAHAVGRVLHSMKRIEASQGRFFWTESQFKVVGPDFPRHDAPSVEVEREVQVYVDRIRTLDRGRKLREV